MNPLCYCKKQDLCLIPRAVVKPDQDAHPSYVKIQKEPNKSAYYFYESIKVNHNYCRAKEIEDLPSVEFKEMHLPCMEPEDNGLESECADSSFEEDALPVDKKF